MSLSISQESPLPITLKLDEKFQPCPAEEGERSVPKWDFPLQHFSASRLSR